MIKSRECPECGRTLPQDSTAAICDRCQNEECAAQIDFMAEDSKAASLELCDAHEDDCSPSCPDRYQAFDSNGQPIKVSIPQDDDEQEIMIARVLNLLSESRGGDTKVCLALEVVRYLAGDRLGDREAARQIAYLPRLD